MDDTPGSERDTCGWDGAAAGFSPGYGGPSCPDQPAPPTGSDQQPAAAAAGKARGSSRRNAWGPHSYADLITQAILSTPERRLTLAQVYEWMVANIPWFKDKGDSTSSAGWKNSVRHNLSLHTRFVKVQNEGTGKSSWWTINPDAKTGKSSRRRSPLDPTKAGGRKRGRSKKRADGAVAEVSDGSAPLGSPTEATGFLDPQTLLYRTAGAGCDRLSPAPIGWPYTGRPQFTPDHQVSYQPDRNGYHTDRNGFHPDRNGFHPDRNGFHPDRNGFHQDRNGLNGFHPDRNGYQPDRSGYTAESNGYLTERNGYLSGEYPTERGDGYSRLEAGRQQQQQETAGAEQGLPPPYHGIPTSGYGMFCGGGAGGGFGSDARRPGSLMVGGGGGHHPAQDVTDHHTAYGIQQVASPPVGSCPMSPGGAAAAAGEGAYPAPAAGGRPPYVSSPSSAPYASFVSGPLDQRRPSSAESEPPPSQEQTPSQLMGSVMGALQPDPALSGLELDAFQGGFVCDVDNIINEELSRDGQLDFAFSQATSGGSGSGSSLSQQHRLAPGGRSISSGSETRLPPAAGVMPRWHHQLNASM